MLHICLLHLFIGQARDRVDGCPVLWFGFLIACLTVLLGAGVSEVI